jgi:DNA-binding transcriptional MerR regulator
MLGFGPVRADERLMTDPSPPLPASSPCLQGELVTFTGTLASMTHRQAMDLVAEHGGTAAGHVSQQTTLLVVGEEGWPLEADGKPSLKLEQVMQLQRQGRAIRILSESEWLNLLGLDDRPQQIQQLYTPAVLSQLLGVPATAIRSWERSGLIHAVRKVCRLPYFDFQEVTSAQRLSELLSAGVPVQEIQRSLSRLGAVLKDIDRPLAQLEILARDRRLIYRDDAGLVDSHSGQRLLDFEPRLETDDAPATLPALAAESSPRMQWTASDWLQEGCRLSLENELPPAVVAFRLALMERPGDPEINFQLADVLYRQGNLAGAIERYYAIVEFDQSDIEAWTQLGCVLAQSGQSHAALEAFDIALDAHPDYAEAHLHKADVLHGLGEQAAAIEHWQAYLRIDNRGPWAELARRRLEEAAAMRD